MNYKINTNKNTNALIIFIILLSGLVIFYFLEIEGGKEGFTQSNYDNYDYSNSLPDGIPSTQIPRGQEDLYILKTQIVPLVCPTCQSNKECPSCPDCDICNDDSND